MQYDQRHTKCLWMPPSGDYSLHIAPASARATANKATITNAPTLLAILMAITMQQYNTSRIARGRRSRASLEATGCHHWASTHFNSIKGTCLPRLFAVYFIVELLKRPQSTRIAPNINRGMTYQTNEKHLTSLIEYFVGGLVLHLIV